MALDKIGYIYLGQYKLDPPIVLVWDIIESDMKMELKSPKWKCKGLENRINSNDKSHQFNCTGPSNGQARNK